MAGPPSFEALLEQLRKGDEAAGQLIFQCYAQRLIGLARGHLGGLIRQKVDPEDVVQSVFKSFFRRHTEESFDLEDWESLWSLLTVITLRKCANWNRHFGAACRDVRREQKPTVEEDSSNSSWEAIAREPTPDEAVVFADTLEQLFRGLDASDRLILELRLQGLPVPQISTQVGRAERTVYRLLDRIKERLERLAASNSPAT